MLTNNMQHTLSELRSKSPLVHNITNFVAMDLIANSLLAVGASPVMAHSKDEVTEMVFLASCLVINIGTLSPNWIESMEVAITAAHRRGVPVVLDPVGAGATSFRTATAARFLSMGVTVLRGNGSEILALGEETEKARTKGVAKTKGVDSQASSESATNVAKNIAKKFNTTVVISGATDLIINTEGVSYVRNGHPMMTKVTGLGCSASSVVGAFLALGGDPRIAATTAMKVMGVAGEMAFENATTKAPGSFRASFVDALYCLDDTILEKRGKVE